MFLDTRLNLSGHRCNGSLLTSAKLNYREEVHVLAQANRGGTATEVAGAVETSHASSAALVPLDGLVVLFYHAHMATTCMA